MDISYAATERARPHYAEAAPADAALSDLASIALESRYCEQLHALGVQTFLEGRTADAVALILRALAADGGNAPRYNDLGNILAQTGDLTHAAIAFRAALERSSEDAGLWNNLGSVLHRLQDYAGAETAYRNALYVNADFASALNNLALLLEQTGRIEESSWYACRAFVLPPHQDKLPKMLGIAYYRLGRTAEAAECYRAWLKAEPDNGFARYHLAACTGENVPAQTPAAYVTAIFDEMAAHFDDKLLNTLAYRGPEIMATLLDTHLPATATLDVLDAGCGTGLCAPLLKPSARRLSGVDLSPAMLAKARAGKLYDELAKAEITGWLSGKHEQYDLIVMSDTLIYFGDLAPVLQAARGALRSGGQFVFTVEALSAIDSPTSHYKLGPSGRYAHSHRYLFEALEAAGFAILRNEKVVLRNEFCQPTQGFGLLAATA